MRKPAGGGTKANEANEERRDGEEAKRPKFTLRVSRKARRKTVGKDAWVEFKRTADSSE
jgi:hypothetical protein